MTSKELLYVEDALGHEKFMKCCARENVRKINRPCSFCLYCRIGKNAYGFNEQI